MYSLFIYIYIYILLPCYVLIVFMLNIPVLDLQFGSTNVSIMYFLQLCRP